MLNENFIEAAGDYYGSWTLDDLADLLGVRVDETMSALLDYFDDHVDIIEREMDWNENEDEGESS